MLRNVSDELLDMIEHVYLIISYYCTYLTSYMYIYAKINLNCHVTDSLQIKVAIQSNFQCKFKVLFYVFLE